MDAKQVIDKIISEAQSKAARIKSDGDSVRQSQEEQLKKELAGYDAETSALAQKQAKDKKLQMLSAARMEISNQYLAEKRRLLDEVFDRAAQRIKSLPDEQYLDLFKKLLLEAVETGDEEVVVDFNESRIDSKFLKEINRQLASGSRGELRLSGQKENIGAGFVLKRGKVRTNVSLNVLLEQARERLDGELSRRLFD